MASRVPRGPAGPGLHTAGIYADMTVDGPEIGTLVMIIDRAKNLPNRRTMGKQNPYCAARLGKEAKKTETDKRGGQTPRWDQELRFTVHDSPDYNHVKVSLFNDDKKTDLIGETMINLGEVLQPGGGQGDQWHSLNCKGRYAGEIRIELTYYDSRPKHERSRDRGKKYSVTDLVHLDQQAAMASANPQSAVKRRPVPTDFAGMASSHLQSPNIPPPITELRSHHTPPLHDSPTHPPTHRHISNESEHHIRQDPSFTSIIKSHSGRSRPLPSPIDYSHGSAEASTTPHNNSNTEGNYEEPENLYHEQQEQEQDGFDSYDMPVTDDPYALEAVHSQNYLKNTTFGPQPIPPRNHRVLELSGSPLPRPSPNLSLTHAHSAPLLGVNEHYQEMDNEFHEASHEWSQGDAFGHSTFNDDKAFDSFSYPQHHGVAPYDAGFIGDAPDHSVPPPPPVHRSSAPAVTRIAGRPMSAQQSSPRIQPRYGVTTRAELLDNSTYALNYGNEHDAGRHMGGAPTNCQQVQGSSLHYNQQIHHRHQSVDGLDSQYRNSQFRTQPNPAGENRRTSPVNPSNFEPRRSLGPVSERSIHPHLSDDFTRGSPGGKINFNSPRPYDSRDHPHIRTTPLIKPRAISPNRESQSSPHNQIFATPPPTIPQPRQTSSPSPVPYSPDSFTVFNPQHSNSTSLIGRNTPGTQRELSPMYSSQTSGTMPNTPQPPSSAVSADPPIVGSNGKVKDPTDHLPPSSYAPEPERKGNRPSIVVNQRNRFGPREARSLPVTARQQHSAPSSPITTRPSAHGSAEEQPSRQSQQHSELNSPLTPSQDGLLNTQYGHPRYIGHGSGYDRVEIFAPPIPAKIPLDFRGGNAQMTRVNGSLAGDMAGLSLDGSADNTAGGIYGGRGGATRPRRSRFGA